MYSKIYISDFSKKMQHSSKVQEPINLILKKNFEKWGQVFKSFSNLLDFNFPTQNFHVHFTCRVQKSFYRTDPLSRWSQFQISNPSIFVS